MRDRQDGCACRIHAQCARPEADGPEAVNLEERQFEGVPTSLRPDSDENPSIGMFSDRRTDGRRGVGIRHETKAFAEQHVQLILDEHPELPMYRDEGQPRVARLLHPFDEQWAVTRLCQDVGIEVLAFHTLGIRQDDLSDTQRRELCPESPHHFRSGKSDQHIDSGPARDVRLEHAAQGHPTITGGFHGTNTEGTIK
jgi:hypothetical protein